MSQATIDWGDGGAVQSVPIVGTLNAWSLTDVPHAYAEGGPYTIRVTGPSAGTDTEAITVPMTPAVLGFAVASDAGSVNTITINRPAEAVNNSVLYAFVRGQLAGTTDFTSPGWTRVGPTFVPSDTQRVTGWYMRPVIDVTAEPASYVFTRTGNGRLIGAILAVSGAAGGLGGFDPAYSGTGLTTGTPQSRDTAAYPVSVVHGLQLFGVGGEHTSPNSDVPVTKPAGFTERVSAVTAGGTGVSRTSLWIGSRKTDTPASAASFTTAGQSLAAESITIKPPTPNTTFATVTEMLAKPGFTWAHRGNSQYYAEESLYAYRQAVARGYVCLEVSMNRTSDGVWVLCHDRDINRTSGLTAGTQPFISTMTWAQVQAFQNTISVDNSDRPYSRWEDFLAEFGNRGFIFILDPKYAWIDAIPFRDEFWAMCLAAGGPDKVIPKYFIDTTGLATQAQARGYKAWGYAYAATLADGNFATWANAPWAMLGMEISATQPQWDTIKGFGKPVIGHIDLVQSDYDLAITKGAAGVQVGGSQQVRAVNKLS